MGLLSGAGAGILQSVFKAVHLPGTIYKVEKIYDDFGEITDVVTEYEASMQVDSMTEAMRKQEGAVDTDRMMLVLTDTAAPVNTDCEIVTTQPGYAGARFSVMSVASDPLFSHWILRVRALGG